jgi:hypothetical protein
MKYLLVFLLGLARPVEGQQRVATEISALKLVEGVWVGEGSSRQAGQGAGTMSFESDLGGTIMIRRNRAEYPVPNKPPFVHEDIMIVYPDSVRHAIRAFYTDTEHHIITYTVYASGGGDTLTFLSEPRDNEPQYRLTYAKLAAGRLSVGLEAAPAGTSEFKRIVQGTLKKRE